MTLRELEIGDIFVSESDRSLYPVKYIVRNNNMVAVNNGIALRKCLLLNGTLVSKSSDLNVIKTGESKHKQKLQKLYGINKTKATSTVIPVKTGIS